VEFFIDLNAEKELKLLLLEEKNHLEASCALIIG
jgi:hypothetical protein